MLTHNYAALTNPAELGTSVTFTLLAGVASTASVNGIFDNGYAEGVGMEGAQPSFGCAVTDVPGVRHDDALTIDEVEYVVKEVKPDGDGWVDLVLELAP